MKGDRTRPALLYLVTNTLNGKKYVGVTTHTNARRRLSEHVYSAVKRNGNGAFYRALRKYGREVFEIVILQHYPSCHAALAAEVAYIAQHAPEYNSTKGGDAGNGGHISPSGRDRMRSAGLGNTYRLGSTHTSEVRAILRGHGYRNIAVFRRYSSLGPQKQAKRVRCLDDSSEWPSASAAARHFNVAKSSLIELCGGSRHRKSVGGLRFEYVEQ